ELALQASTRPSILALTRQAVPNLRTAPSSDNLCAKGAYVLEEANGKRAVTLIATGSEVGLAVSAAEALEKDGVAAAVVSMPSFELFREQTDAYRSGVLGEAPRIAIEAAVQQSWNEWLRPGDAFVGLSDFGASAPGPKVYEHFGLTAEGIAAKARKLVKQ
ncbi:MAG: transketolase, partial [Hyphomicrobiaceae bacterium]